jgi:hypothetical protein
MCRGDFSFDHHRYSLMQSSGFHSYGHLSTMEVAYSNKRRSNSSVNNLREILTRQSGDRNLDILIGASTATAVATLLHETLDFSKSSSLTLPTEISEAFHLTYPHVDINKLATLSESDRMHYVNGLVGKLFEIRVRDALNAGHQVGGLKLEDGQIAKLAESANQQGWDLQVEPGNELFQLKCSDDIHYMMSEFSEAQNFDSQIGAIFSADAGRIDLEDVYVSDISSSELRHEVISSLQASGDNSSEISQFMHEYGDEMLESIAVVGTVVSVYALVKQIKRMRNNYKNGVPVKEIAEREATSIVGRVVAITPIPYAGRAARTVTDRIHFGSKFRQKKQAISENLRDLISKMKESHFDFEPK